jgi:hypothetical protein
MVVTSTVCRRVQLLSTFWPIVGRSVLLFYALHLHLRSHQSDVRPRTSTDFIKQTNNCAKEFLDGAQVDQLTDCLTV